VSPWTDGPPEREYVSKEMHINSGAHHDAKHCNKTPMCE
jgi:hypothetical protein